MKLPIVSPVGPDSPDPSSAQHDLEIHQLLPLLTAFYEEVETDTLLSPYFAAVDMHAHMPRIVAFWETMVFQAGTYSGNAFRPHLDMPGLNAQHFARWVGTMERTVNRFAAGPRAERMKDLAHRVAYSMQVRLGITPYAEWREEG